jgi:hypothetical protein
MFHKIPFLVAHTKVGFLAEICQGNRVKLCKTEEALMRLLGDSVEPQGGLMSKKAAEVNTFAVLCVIFVADNQTITEELCIRCTFLPTPCSVPVL